jgi:DNA-binding Xre family transcriptional regulator
MYSLDDYRTKLYDRSIKIVSDTTGISQVTLWRIKSGKAKNITLNTAEKLNKYFEARP